MKKTITTILMSAALCVASTAHANVVLQLDFGGGTVFDGTNNATNAPAGIADTTYNGISGNVATSITNTGLLFGDGSAATGVTVEIGEGAPGEAFFNGTFAADAGNNNGTNPDGTGVGGTELTNDWIFTRNGDHFGVRVKGLEAGFYDVYTLAREPNQLGRAYSVGTGVAETADINDLTQQAIGSITANTTFIDGGNFVVQRVEVTSITDYITVIVDPTDLGTDDEDRFGTIGGLQIVGVEAIPEPSSLALLSLGGLGFIVRRRRR